MFECRVCKDLSAHKKTYLVKEMFFGTGEAFLYFECPNCGTLQLTELPTDMSVYYPPDYYSYKKPKHDGTASSFKKFYKKRWFLHATGEKRTLIGAFVARRRGVPKFAQWLTKLDADFENSILDIGCGSGSLISKMQQAGFENVRGIDPYLPSDVVYKGGLRIEKCRVAETTGTYDIIMLHHAFEHMPDPVETFKHLNRLLNRQGRLLIRIPVADCWAWHTYRTHWVQLDAPRHLFLHTRKSMRILGSYTSLHLYDVFHDSTAFQFWGSEQYRSGIPMFDDTSYQVNPQRSIFEPAEIKAFEQKAEALNRAGQGDQACFYYRKP
jgi:SAM-dependent methyltransferase